MEAPAVVASLALVNSTVSALMDFQEQNAILTKMNAQALHVLTRESASKALTNTHANVHLTGEERIVKQRSMHVPGHRVGVFQQKEPQITEFSRVSPSRVKIHRTNVFAPKVGQALNARLIARNARPVHAKMVLSVQMKTMRTPALACQDILGKSVRLTSMSVLKSHV